MNVADLDQAGQDPEAGQGPRASEDPKAGRAGQGARSGRAGRAARRRTAAVAALRRHWLAAALLAAGLVLRVLAELAYRPALFYIDTNRYLLNVAQGMDPVGYEGPLRAILFVANFDAVAAFQHLLGLAMAVVLYLLLLRRGASRWLAALAIAPVLLDAYQVQIEQMIMPDALFEALIVAGLAILLWQPTPSWRRVVAAGVVLGTSATVAQIGEALLLPAVIYLLAAGGGWRPALGRATALSVAFAVPILAYCTGSYLLTKNFFLSHTGVTSLYGRTASAADCVTLRLPPAERAMCPAPAQQAHGPDWLEYNQASPVERSYYNNPGLSRGQTDALITDFNHAVLAQQPARVLAAYGRDVARLFAPVRAGSPSETPISRWQFQAAFPFFPPHSSRQEVEAEVSRFGGGAPAVWRPVAAFLRAYQLGGGYTPGPLFAVFALAGLGGSAAVLRRRRAGTEAARAPGAGSEGAAPPGAGTRQLALACLLFFSSAASVLLVSDLFEFSWRYQLPALVTLAPAGALGIAVITIAASRGPGRARGR